MLSKARLVVLEALELSLNFVYIRQFFRGPTSPLHICKRVTKIAACLCLMCSIVTHAQPAELMLALAAGHVHAALVLLDWPLTLRAWLSVDLQPVL